MSKLAKEPAFARPGFTDRESESQEGMTFRQYAAVQAMTGLLANSSWLETVAQAAKSDLALTVGATASQAVRSADALIAELEKEQR